MTATTAHDAARASLPEHLLRDVVRAQASLPSPATPAPSPGPGVDVVACDLDRTLVYSRAAWALPDDGPAVPLVVAEHYEGRPLSFHTQDAGLMLDLLAQVAVVVPTTTRTVAQYRRIRLPGPPPRWAVTTNGARLLHDGEVCPEWSAHVDGVLAAGAPLAEVLAHLEVVTAHPWRLSLRSAEDVFAYLVVDRPAMPEAFLTELTAWCDERGWTVSLQGRKVYCVPRPLTKSAAAREVVRRAGAGRLLAAGDSLLDAGLLAAADLAVRPAHGELHDTGWAMPHVAVTGRPGVLGGQDVVTWLLAAVLARTA